MPRAECRPCGLHVEVSSDSAFSRAVVENFEAWHKGHVVSEDRVCQTCGGHGETWHMVHDGREVSDGPCSECGGKGVI